MPLFLSIIIPAHNEANRLPAALADVQRFLDAQPYEAEILVVENGSRDDTLAIARSLQTQHPTLRVLHEPLPGKGRAVRRGMLEAAGEYRFMCDVDFSMPVERLNSFLPPSIHGVDIAIASREAPGAVRYNEPAHRHFIGRIFNGMIRLLALPEFQDTQCGFKCFRREAAESLFPLQRVTGWTFDVEILLLARRQGWVIRELPVPWYYNPESKVRIGSDSARMALDLLKIRLNLLRGAYDTRRK